MSKSPSVLMVLHDLGALGGAERQAWRLSQELQQRRINIELVTGSWNGQKVGCQVDQGIPIHYIPTMGYLIPWRGGRRISRYVMLFALFAFLWRHHHKYQILHFHESDFLAVAGVLISRLFKKRVLTKMRASGEWSDLQNILKHWRGPEKSVIIDMLRRADQTIVLNEESTQELLAAGFQANRLVKMVNGIDAENFMPRLDYTLHTPPTVGFVGRLEAQKDVNTLLQALPLVNRPGVQALIIGDGPQRPFLEKTAQELGLKERVRFCGRVSNVADLLPQIDLFVLPSVAEGISNALLEAMASGLPCLATDIPGNRAVIRAGIDGHLFAPGQPTALAHLLTTLLADENLRRQTGQAARGTVTQRFSIQAVTEAYLTLYYQLLAP